MTEPAKSEPCASCRAPLQGDFCSQCGERKLVPQLRQFGHLLGDFAKDITSLDGKLVRSFAHLLFFPGRSELNFHRGARVQFMKPIALFLLINVIFVTLMPLTDFFLTYSDQQRQFYSPVMQQWLQSHIAASGLTEQVFSNNYDQLVKVLARSIIIVSVPFLLPFVVLMFRDKRYFLSDHFVFALNVWGWWLLWMLVSWWSSWSLAYVAQWAFDFDLNPYRFNGTIALIGLVVYLYLAITKMYQHNWWQTLLKMPVIIIGVAVSHMMFRFVQFVVTVWSV